MVIFEDSPDSPVSALFDYAYTEYVAFSGENNRLRSKAKDGVVTALLVDYVPDNPATVSLYRKLWGYYSYSDYIHVIPIPCVEFLILRWLHSQNKLHKSKHLTKFIDSLHSTRITYNDPSYEKFCKTVLNTQRACIRNYNDDSNDLVGKFYRQDCDCPVIHCSTTDIKLFTKACSSLNFMIFKRSELTMGDLEDIYNQSVEWYRNIEKAVGLPCELLPLK